MHEEVPMLWTPHPAALATTCHACLRPLAPGGGPYPAADPHGTGSGGGATGGLSAGNDSAAFGLHYCLAGCRANAEAMWAAAAADCDLRPLQQACREGGDKFPLMAAQLACMQVQRWQQPDQEADQEAAAGGANTSATAAAAGVAAAAAPRRAEPGARGDALTQLQHLCYANVAEPPEPWARLHSLLLRGLQPLTESPRWAATCTAGRLRREFSLDWFCSVLARLHLNAFR